MKTGITSDERKRRRTKRNRDTAFYMALEKRGCSKGVDDRLGRFLVPPQRRSDYTDIQMKAAPLALAATVTYHRIILISCRKTDGSYRGVRRLAEKGIVGYAHFAGICNRVGLTSSSTLRPSFRSTLSVKAIPLSEFLGWGRPRGLNAQGPSSLFLFVEFHPSRYNPRRVGGMNEHAQQSREMDNR